MRESFGTLRTLNPLPHKLALSLGESPHALAAAGAGVRIGQSITMLLRTPARGAGVWGAGRDIRNTQPGHAHACVRVHVRARAHTHTHTRARVCAQRGREGQGMGGGGGCSFIRKARGYETYEANDDKIAHVEKGTPFLPLSGSSHTAPSQKFDGSFMSILKHPQTPSVSALHQPTNHHPYQFAYIQKLITPLECKQVTVSSASQRIQLISSHLEPSKRDAPINFIKEASQGSAV
jgi:hypothetical protein